MCTSGTEQWRFETDSWVQSSPTVVDSTVYVESFDDHLYAVETGHEESSRDSRVLLGTLGHHDTRFDTDPATVGPGGTTPS